MLQRTYVVLPFDLFPGQVQTKELNSLLNLSCEVQIGSNYRFVILFIHFFICCRTSLMCCSPCNFMYLRSFDMSGCWKFAGCHVHLLTSGLPLCSWRLLLGFLCDQDHLLESKANCLTVFYLINILWITQSY